MSRIITAIPFLLLASLPTSASDSFPDRLGSTFSPYRNTASCIAFQDTVGMSTGGPAVVFYGRILESQEDVAKMLSVSTRHKAKAKVKLVSASGEMKVDTGFQFTSSQRSVSWVVSARAEFPEEKIDAAKGFKVGDAWSSLVTVPSKPERRLLQSSKKYQADVDAWQDRIAANWGVFKQTCGDYYVDGFQRQASINIVFTYQFKTLSEANAFTLFLEGEVKSGPIAAEQLTKIAASATSQGSSGDISLSVLTDGMSAASSTSIVNKIDEVDVLKSGNYSGLLKVASQALGSLQQDDAAVAVINAVPVQSLFPAIVSHIALPDANDLAVQEGGGVELYTAQLRTHDSLTALRHAERYPAAYGLSDSDLTSLKAEATRLSSALMALDDRRVACVSAQTHEAIAKNCRTEIDPVAAEIASGDLSFAPPTINFDLVFPKDEIALRRANGRWTLVLPKSIPMGVDRVTVKLNTGPSLGLSQLLDSPQEFRGEVDQARDAGEWWSQTTLDQEKGKCEHMGWSDAGLVDNCKNDFQRRHDDQRRQRERYTLERTAQTYELEVVLENGHRIRFYDLHVK